MADLLFVAIIVAFFGVAVLLVRACDAIIGPDPSQESEPARETAPEPERAEPVSSR